MKMHRVSQAVIYLDERSVPSAIVGGVALAAHGVARATLDADLLVNNPIVLNREFWSDWEATRLEIRRGDPDDPLAGVVQIKEDDSPLDVIVGKHKWMAPIVTRRMWVDIEGISLPVVEPADLILLKLFAGGPQDLVDIEILLTGSTADLQKVVEPRLKELPAQLTRLWGKIRQAH
jgi:hypothetical protein